MIVQFITETLKKFDPNFDEARLKLAIHCNFKSHKSNDNYALKIAKIITSIYPDSNAVITALLFFSANKHNSELIDAQYDNTEIIALFKATSKLFKIYNRYYSNKQQDTFQLLLSLDQDIAIRILLIRFSYLLHKIIYSTKIIYMEYYFIALEISDIYVPLLKAVRLEDIQTILQDLCFQILQPEISKFIYSTLETQYLNRDLLNNEVINNLHNILSRIDICYKIYGRIKSPYSIWKKTVYKSSEVEKLFDIIGVRIIANKETECYKILQTIHNDYKIILGRFKNFITFPKSNGYQSLHTVIVNPALQKIEVQICTQKMYDITSLGFASHLHYKMRAIINQNLNITYKILNNLISTRLSKFILSIQQKTFHTGNRGRFLSPYILDGKQDSTPLLSMLKSQQNLESPLEMSRSVSADLTLLKQQHTIATAIAPVRLPYVERLVSEVGNIKQNKTSTLPNQFNALTVPVLKTDIDNTMLETANTLAHRSKRQLANIANKGAGIQEILPSPISHMLNGFQELNFICQAQERAAPTLQYVSTGNFYKMKKPPLKAKEHTPTTNNTIPQETPATLVLRNNSSIENIEQSTGAQEILPLPLYYTTTNICEIPTESPAPAPIVRRAKREVINIERDETPEPNNTIADNHVPGHNVSEITAPIVLDPNINTEFKSPLDALQNTVNSIPCDSIIHHMNTLCADETGEVVIELIESFIYYRAFDNMKMLCDNDLNESLILPVREKTFEDIKKLCDRNFLATPNIPIDPLTYADILNNINMIYGYAVLNHSKDFIITYLYENIRDNITILYDYQTLERFKECIGLLLFECMIHNIQKLYNCHSLEQLTTFMMDDLSQSYNGCSLAQLKEGIVCSIYNTALHNIKTLYDCYSLEQLTVFGEFVISTNPPNTYYRPLATISEINPEVFIENEHEELDRISTSQLQTPKNHFTTLIDPPLLPTNNKFLLSLNALHDFITQHKATLYNISMSDPRTKNNKLLELEYNTRDHLKKLCKNGTLDGLKETSWLNTSPVNHPKSPSHNIGPEGLTRGDLYKSILFHLPYLRKCESLPQLEQAVKFILHDQTLEKAAQESISECESTHLIHVAPTLYDFDY
ncbi:hypothetical protein [Candidatus Tisiphia endosymbiont of Nemotelus uliginosus]|uniref:hypothetical protein n=1 Tax=Candidatus Tisiphia endosymbiont of Nemotelus uliginosus TaxID=3077926 RepID=UPI0035C8F844